MPNRRSFLTLLSSLVVAPFVAVREKKPRMRLADLEKRHGRDAIRQQLYWESKRRTALMEQRITAYLNGDATIYDIVPDTSHFDNLRGHV